MLSRFRHWLHRRALRRHEAKVVKRSHYRGDAELDLLVEMLRRFEGYRSNAYMCGGKVWTYGYGSTYRPDGQRVQPGDNITEAAARRLLTNVAHRVLIDARALLTEEGHKPSVGCVAAVASLIYNMGLSRVAKSKFLKAWRKGNMAKAKYEFIDFNKIDGEPSRGLTLRREAEWETLIGKQT